MKSFKTLAVIGAAAVFAAPAHAYERCRSFGNAELKAMTQEGLEKAYCWNEDRLLEILELGRSSASDEAKRDRDACWDTLLKLSAQPQFDRGGPCPGAVQAGSGGSPEDSKRRKAEVLRNLENGNRKEPKTQ